LSYHLECSAIKKSKPRWEIHSCDCWRKRKRTAGNCCCEMASPASSTMHRRTRRKASKGALCDTAFLPGVRVDRSCEPRCRIAEASESAKPPRGRILRRDVCAALPCGRFSRTRDYRAGIELAGLCGLSEGREGLDAAHAGDSSAPGCQRQLQYRAEHLGRCALFGMAHAAVSQRSQACSRRLLRR